jgi:hypothetical protein
MCPFASAVIADEFAVMSGRNRLQWARIRLLSRMGFLSAVPVSSLAQMCDGRTERRESAETFRRMRRSDHRNSLVPMGTRPRNGDQ